MLEIKSKLKVPRNAYALQVKGALRLPFEQRQKSRLHAKLVSGEEVALMLPRGEILRGGDLVTASDGRIIEVIAEVEKLAHVECESPQALARAAYHLGNRHVPVESRRRLPQDRADRVLEEMLKGLGAKVSHIESAFEPEAGAMAAATSTRRWATAARSTSSASRTITTHGHDHAPRPRP
jgi:urease accessory protein